jgi:hypothetical protein
MPIVGFLIIGILVFGICYIVDKGFTNVFRGKAQHSTGKSVRLNKRFGSFGLILSVLGLAALFSGLSGDLVLGIGGGVVLVVGVGLVVYYMTFGLFYDNDSFLLTRFAHKSVTYRFEEIRGQMLYTASGNIVIELHMNDGQTVGLQGKMDGVYSFLDAAFDGWCKQKGICPEDCPFHDTANSLWFPTVEE